MVGGLTLLVVTGLSIFCERRQRRRERQRAPPAVVVTCPTSTTPAPAPDLDDRARFAYIAPPGFATNPALGTPGPGQLLKPEE
jgi:hypothetical protein